MTSRDRVLAALAHKTSDRVPVDFGGTFVSGIHVSVVAALRDYYGLEKRLVKVIDPGQMLGEVEEDLKQVLGVDTECVLRSTTRYGFPNRDWKPWRMPDGLEVLVPGGFNVTRGPAGEILMHPGGNIANPPSAVMPSDGFFFDNIERQPEIDEDALDPRDNLVDFQPLSEEELQFLEASARRARATGRAVIGSFGGTLRDVPVWDVGAAAVRAAVERSGIDAAHVDRVIFGNCRQAGNGPNPARTAAVRGGLPIASPVVTVNMACPSGMKTVMLAARELKAGDARLVMAGGMESMSTMPYRLKGARWEGFRSGDKTLLDAPGPWRESAMGGRLHSGQLVDHPRSRDVTSL